MVVEEEGVEEREENESRSKCDDITVFSTLTPSVNTMSFC